MFSIKSVYKNQIINLLIAVVLLLFSVFQLFAARVNAASLTSTHIMFHRMMAATATTFSLVFTVPSGNSGSEASIRIEFPDSYTVATTGITAGGTGCSATTVPGTLAATGSNTPGSKNISITGVTDLSASATYCVTVDRTSTNDPITNPAAGPYSITISTRTGADALIDSATIGARVITNDQIAVSAVVPPSFNFVLDGNSTAFTANLDSGSVQQTQERTVTISTNASTGWIAWAKGANTGLTSAAAGHTIPAITPGTGANLTAGAEGYVLGVDSTDAGGGGTVSVTAAYQGTDSNNNGSGLDTTYRQIASSNGTANGDVLQLYGKASIAGQTPAANDYSDTWTVIGAGSF